MTLAVAPEADLGRKTRRPRSGGTAEADLGRETSADRRGGCAKADLCRETSAGDAWYLTVERVSCIPAVRGTEATDENVYV